MPISKPQRPGATTHPSGDARALRYSQIGILLAAVVLLGIIAYAVHTVRSFQKTSEDVLHLQEVRLQTAETLSHLKDIHLNTRAYLINRDERALAARQQNIADFGQGIAALRTVTAGNPAQQEALSELEDLVGRLVLEYDGYIELRRTQSLAAVTRLADGEAKRLAEEARVAAVKLQAGEAQRLAALLRGARSDGSLTLAVLGGGLALTAVLVFAVVATLRRDFRTREAAAAALERLNTSLHARGVELEAANRELEAFSYSVSHDLRAPLRHIDYFAGSLQKHLPPEQLDAKARHDLATISDAARGMGQLIDDLLSFARISRIELQRTRVSLDEIVKETRAGLQTEIRERKIAWDISPLPAVHGDPALLRQVFINLLSNAIKYTRPRDEARIEIVAEPAPPGEVIVRVRDNGAGFDMNYADKLFGVFQRLHGHTEFEGTGVGLANVRRIVERHGGRVWAEAAVNQGATFRVSLPAPAGANGAATHSS